VGLKLKVVRVHRKICQNVKTDYKLLELALKEMFVIIFPIFFERLTVYIIIDLVVLAF